MKSRPILFSAPMVRAILEGRKTQTRRALKPKWPLADVIPADGAERSGLWYGAKQVPLKDEGDMYGFRCRHGVIGDELWVRETWAERDDILERGKKWRHYLRYRADGGELAHEYHHYARWRPSIHMPRAASRITLRITSVRCERLQDMTEQDAIAEGGMRYELGEAEEGPRIGWRHDGKGDGLTYESPRDSFAVLWDSINGTKAPWSSNPWVWVIGFEKTGNGDSSD